MDFNLIISQAITQGIGVQAVIFALAAIGLNVHFGYTGLLNFGQAGFLAVGAYGLGVTVTTLGLSFWLGLVVGLGAAVVFALLLGIPTLRLRADYLAIVTIAAAEIIRLTARSVTLRDVFGGSDGINRFANEFYALNPFDSGLALGPINFSRNDLFVVVVGWILVAVACLIVFLSMRAPWGRVLKGIREDEDAVRSLGKNVYSYKLQALVLGGVLGCLGGFVFAVSSQSVQPDNYGTDLTFFAWAALILGGAARVFGPVLGSIIFWFLLVLFDVALSEAVRSGLITFIDGTQVGQIRFWILGLSLMLLMIFRPQGILGDKRELAFDVK
ncbi:MAG: branched-chain amino acid ABC transporter permease [Actinomycetia bacterium]|nr:branched-chain amino acid ABC transporter permease [Actinomycetes bacterium]MCH9800064.1 branched-chain amino acid ABC transporter permease [Actinomycetes bacterium]